LNLELTTADYPTTTKWLSEEEKILAVVRLQVREEDEEHMSHKAAFVEAIKDPKTWASVLVDCNHHTLTL
jgi:hypothetical protein